MKRIAVAKANEIEFEFDDRLYRATFNMLAMQYMQQELLKLGESMDSIPLEHLGSLILYSGIKVNHEDYTIEEATTLALTIKPCDLNEIINEYLESSGVVKSSEEDAVAKKVMAQILLNLATSK